MNNENVILIGVVSTFFISILNILLSTKTMRKSKYIETVTTRRGKWIDSTREDFAKLATQIYLSLAEFNIRLTRLETEKWFKEALLSGELDDVILEDNPLENNSPVNIRSETIFGKKFFRSNTSDILHFIYLVELKLNYREDMEIFELLACFKSFYSESKLYRSSDIKVLDDKLKHLIYLVQLRLNSEMIKIEEESGYSILSKKLDRILRI